MSDDFKSSRLSRFLSVGTSLTKASAQLALDAAKTKAQSYLDYSSFSRQGLIDQLVFEGFTQEQAEYGVSAVGY